MARYVSFTAQEDFLVEPGGWRLGSLLHGFFDDCPMAGVAEVEGGVGGHDGAAAGAHLEVDGRDHGAGSGYRTVVVGAEYRIDDGVDLVEAIHGSCAGR